LQRARALDGFEPPLEMADALANPPAVDFQLSFPRPPCADATAEPRQMRPLACQTRQQILKLSELHLELAFAAAGALGKDIENQLATVDNPDFESHFQITLLGRREILIENDQICLILL